MLNQIWQKQVPLLIELSSNDVADDCQPLPLFLMGHWHHYVGFYYSLIHRFY